MMHSHTVDLAIVGGGCAGLSLIRELASRGYGGTVAVIEPRQSYQDDRSWCFWSADDHPMRHVVSHSWPQWLFGVAPHAAQARSCKGHAYRYIRSLDFYQSSMDVLAASPHMTLHQGQAVTQIHATASGWSVLVGAQPSQPSHTWHATHVIDTRPPAESELAKSTLFQCFVGVEITLPQPQWDHTQAEVMTDMRVCQDEFCFTYILPLSATRALVEVTFFATHRMSMDVIDAELMQLLERRGWSHATHVRREAGVLPMGLPLQDVSSPQTTIHKPVRAGAGGGALRASSGFGFMRIQRWAAQCAQQLADGLAPCGQTEPSSMLHRMDHLFLDVLAHQPARGPVLFQRLFGNLDPQRFIRFMDDRPTALDLMLLVACLPKTPFLSALCRRITK